MKFLLFICIVCYCFLCADSLRAGEIGFDEEFSLASDRSVPLKQLIPGTEDYYYYSCLYHQQRGEFDQVDKILEQWINRYSHTQRVKEIRNRQALLKYPTNQGKTLEHIVFELDLLFNHEKKRAVSKKTFPSQLNADIYAFAELKQAALRDYTDLSGFEPAGVEALSNDKLDPDRRRDFLNRMVRPDGNNLAQMVVDDLQYKHSGGFGSIGIHNQLLIKQLEFCAQKIPQLLNETNFVMAYLKKLQPGEDQSWENDPAEKLAFLQRMYKFVSPLAPIFNSLKANLLYHILDVNRSNGIYDRAMFIEYLKLPRNVSYINYKFLDANDGRHRADLNANYSASTLFGAIGNDEPLVRDFLQKILVDEKDGSAFAGYIESNYLQRLLAETKILSGVGDMESWFSMLNAHEVKDLKERIELEFLPDNKVVIKPEDKIELNVRIKNVKKLIIKIYKLNLVNFYRVNLNEVTTAIDLDGLVANEERIVEYALPDHRRHHEKFSFPDLGDKGVFVIELIGNGMSSRALVRRGQLSFVQRPGAAGHLFTVFNDAREQVKDAVILLNGQEYRADKAGLINVPFSTSPGARKIIISQGDFASLHTFNHEAEGYSFTGSFHVDREALVAGKNASLIFRPALFANSYPVDINLLKEVVLTITSTDHEGVESTREVSDFKLFNNQESTFEFKVPEKLSQLRFAVKGKVENLSMGRKDDLAVSRTFSLNSIEKTEKTHAFYVRRDGENHIVELLGKTGEPCAARPVNVELKHRMIRRSMNVTLQTDDNGRLELGRLTDIAVVTLSGPENISFAFTPSTDKNSLPSMVCASLGGTIMIPLAGQPDAKIEDICSLFEIRGGTCVNDYRQNASSKNGCVVIAGLPAGDYELYLKNSQTAIQLKIADGKRIGPYCVSAKRALPVITSTPVQIEAISHDQAGNKLKIKLVNASDGTRVHVFAGRYLPGFNLFEEFARIQQPELPVVGFSQALSRYLSGRNIGDEYRYILERRYARIFPGNMLKQPGLLLNPWSLRKTDTQTRDAAAGGAWAGAPAPEMQAYSEKKERFRGDNAALAVADFASFDFLNESSTLLANLKPDANGVIEIDLEGLKPRQSLQVIAVDRFDVALREVAFAEIPAEHQDLRMSRSLDVEKHFSQQKNISVLNRDQTLILEDITTARIEVFDSLATVFKLFSTINPDTKLAEFSFIVNWPDFDEAKKLELYSKYACHELSFFLYQRDRAFFDKLIKPYIANKRDKTFMDKWLLGQNLAEYLEPWAFARLNTVEKILLGQKLPKMSDRVERHITDLFDLLPDDRERFNHLFKMALSGSALETGDKLGFISGKDGALSDLKAKAAGEGFAACDAAPSVSMAKPMAPPAPMMAKRAMRPSAAPGKSQALMESEESMAVDDFDCGDLEVDSGRRESVRQLFKQVDKTEEWVENNYYQLPIEQQLADLIKVNAFWKDYACHKSGQPFVSRNIAEATGNFSEMMLAMAVIELPFKAEKHVTEFAGAKMTLRAAGNAIVFHEEIRPATEVDQTASILTGQNFFAYSDRYRYEKNERFDKFVTDEFQTRIVYGCQVVLTNPTSSRKKVDVLMQIPSGSLPVLQSSPTRSVHMQLEAFSTQTAEYYFYFPNAGSFRHYPVHVSEGEKMLATARTFGFKVVEELTNFDKTSWPYVSQNASNEEVFKYLEENNIERLDLEEIAFRMKDGAFFERCYDLLKNRQIYNHTLWSYGIMHRHLPAIREFLEHSPIADNCGSSLISEPLVINPVNRHNYQHKEYWPLVNARVYPLGKKREILNDQFAAQYRALLADLKYHEKLTDYDRMAVVYYLLLQDRIEEAAAFFAQVMDAEIVDSIQFKYIKAYLAFSNAQPEIAAQIAEPFKDYPVTRWRNLFADVLAQAAEISGRAATVTDVEDRDQKQRLLAATQPDFELTVDNRTVTLRHRNISEVKINYYLMDIELMFSRKPFVQEVTGQFSIISPNHSVAMPLANASGELKLELPEKFRDSNVMIEVTGSGLVRSAAYYPHSLAVSLVESYGQLHITHQKTSAPISKAYVKVYARQKNGEVAFYKDGYTDLRGKFDYASLSTSQLDNVERFAILIMTEDSGSVIREAAPPAR